MLIEKKNASILFVRKDTVLIYAKLNISFRSLQKYLFYLIHDCIGEHWLQKISKLIILRLTYIDSKHYIRAKLFTTPCISYLANSIPCHPRFIAQARYRDIWITFYFQISAIIVILNSKKRNIIHHIMNSLVNISSYLFLVGGKTWSKAKMGV